ncbi:MAG: hypothetical protein CVV47_06375 [Spirochaetae bacterium HGW-Spirochaetae-3]|jgi:hypothetical protein|nr:MAG: hypothetical protein CVV47_06375 [Spirochaetae bacterium HGW-Spirochaetae-3]
MKGIRTIVTVAVIGAALYFTNPTKDDFGTYYQSKQNGVGFVAKLVSTRTDMKFFSTFTIGPAKKPLERYLGLAKLVFIRIK